MYRLSSILFHKIYMGNFPRGKYRYLDCRKWNIQSQTLAKSYWSVEKGINAILSAEFLFKQNYRKANRFILNCGAVPLNGLKSKLRCDIKPVKAQ